MGLLDFFMGKMLPAVMMGKPRKKPDAALEALKSLFDSGGHVEKATIGMMMDPKSGTPPHCVVGVVMKPNAEVSFEDLVEHMMNEVRPHLKKDEMLDMIDITTARPGDGVVDYLRGEADTFYSGSNASGRQAA